jgi:hypothetical protein
MASSAPYPEPKMKGLDVEMGSAGVRTKGERPALDKGSSVSVDSRGGLQTFGNYERRPTYVREGRNSGPLNPDTMLDNSEALGGKNMPQLGEVTYMNSETEENLDNPGFTADGSHLFKHGTPYGEQAIFNYLPPGMDISRQANALINEMPLKLITDMQYPGDGAFPYKDLPE